MPQLVVTPVVHTRTLGADHLTPAAVFAHLSQGKQTAFLLESASADSSQGRYSFIGFSPESHWEGSFEALKRRFRKRPLPPGLPPFAGGAVGCFRYELMHELEPTSRRKPVGSPEAPISLDFYDHILAFDHAARTLTVISHSSASAAARLAALLAEIPPLPAVELPSSRTPERLPTSSFLKKDYLGAVRKIREHIRNGEIFQAVLSQRFEADCKRPSFEVYRRLRMINPSPYLFFLKQPGYSVAGSSPEMFLRVRDRELLYRPIAGTRPRGPSQEQDRHLIEELLEDPKERAEHMMLVDLGRNDLGRVSEYGTVRVERLMQPESFSSVTHLTSTLSGRLRTDLDALDAVAACFPAGTVSGAPKIRACHILSRLEPCSRGIYAGAIGYLDYSGNLDLCLAIRTLVLRQGKAYAQAGAGIVADSEAEREYQECISKASPLFRALGDSSGTLPGGSQ